MTLTPATLSGSPARGDRGLSRALAFEWTKFTTVRSTWWCLAAAAFLTVALAVVLGLSVSASAANGFDVAQPAPHLAAECLRLGQLALVALAAVAITGEYSSGSITTTLQGVPRRGLMLLAKTLVVSAVAFVAGAISLALGTAVAAVLMGEAGRFTAGQAVSTTLWAGTYTALLAGLVIGVGAALRSVAGTLTSILMLLLAVPQVIRITGVDWLQTASDYLPDTLGVVLMTQPGQPYGPTTALAALTAWTLTAALAGYARLRFQDA